MLAAAAVDGHTLITATQPRFILVTYGPFPLELLVLAVVSLMARWVQPSRLAILIPKSIKLPRGMMTGRCQRNVVFLPVRSRCPIKVVSTILCILKEG